MNAKRCAHCKKLLPVGLRFFNLDRGKHWSSWCKKCLNEKRRAWYYENLERCKKYQKQYREFSKLKRMQRIKQSCAK